MSACELSDAVLLRSTVDTCSHILEAARPPLVVSASRSLHWPSPSPAACGTNSTSSICCGFVGQQVVQQAVHHLGVTWTCVVQRSDILVFEKDLVSVFI